KELEDDDAAEALDELRDYAKKGTLTLLTASKRDDIRQATVLAEILNGSDTKSGTKTSTDTEKTGKSKDSESEDDRSARTPPTPAIGPMFSRAAARTAVSPAPRTSPLCPPPSPRRPKPGRRS